MLTLKLNQLCYLQGNVSRDQVNKSELHGKRQREGFLV